MSFLWLSWTALPFQAAIAAAVLWHALRRENLVRALERQRAQHQVIDAHLVRPGGVGRGP